MKAVVRAFGIMKNQSSARDLNCRARKDAQMKVKGGGRGKGAEKGERSRVGKWRGGLGAAYPGEE
jgi:hypothetical protein